MRAGRWMWVAHGEREDNNMSITEKMVEDSGPVRRKVKFRALQGRSFS